MYCAHTRTHTHTHSLRCGQAAGLEEFGPPLARSLSLHFTVERAETNYVADRQLEWTHQTIPLLIPSMRTLKQTFQNLAALPCCIDLPTRCDFVADCQGFLSQPQTDEYQLHFQLHSTARAGVHHGTALSERQHKRDKTEQTAPRWAGVPLCGWSVQTAQMYDGLHWGRKAVLGSAVGALTLWVLPSTCHPPIMPDHCQPALLAPAPALHHPSSWQSWTAGCLPPSRLPPPPDACAAFHPLRCFSQVVAGEAGVV